nr:hypothetical protein [Tanacetum cinerariifolium]
PNFACCGGFMESGLQERYGLTEMEEGVAGKGPRSRVCVGGSDGGRGEWRETWERVVAGDGGKTAVSEQWMYNNLNQTPPVVEL